jgi:hypothetical protein
VLFIVVRASFDRKRNERVVDVDVGVDIGIGIVAGIVWYMNNYQYIVDDEAGTRSRTDMSRLFTFPSKEG